MRAEDWPAAAEALDRLAASPAYKSWPHAYQRQIQAGRVRVAIGRERSAEALDIARRATLISGADETEGLNFLSAAFAAGDWEAAAHAFIFLSQFGLEPIEALPPGVIGLVAGDEVRRSAGGAALQSAVIDALFDAGYARPASFLWTTRAMRLIEEGNLERAAALLRRVDEPASRLLISVDFRFDPLRDTVPEAFDVHGALERQLHEAQTAARAAEATDLKAPQAYAWALLNRGRAEEALAVLDQALSRAEAAAAASDVALDTDGLIWMFDTRSRALRVLNRPEEALEALRKAAGQPEGGRPNVSHAINLGAFYNDVDRPADALAAVDQLGDAAGAASSYGQGQLMLVRACAWAALGQTGKLASAVAWFEANPEAAPGAAASVAACAGQVDKAAADLIARLNDPERRLMALADVQSWLPPAHETREYLRAKAFWTQVFARDDVKAAIARAGRSERWPLIRLPY